MARATVKATPARPRKAAPANRGHGEKGVAKYDPSKHPRGPDGKFLSKGGPAAGTKAPRAPKAAPKAKPPRKVGTAKQRKGLADQIRAARSGAKTSEARKALLHQVRDLRAKRKEWVRGQGKTQVDKLPKPPKEKKVKSKAEPKPKAAKEAKPKKSAAKPVASKPKEAAKPATSQDGPDLRSHYATLKDLPAAKQREAMAAYVDKHATPAKPVQVHGMSRDEEMQSVPFDGYNLHFPRGDVDVVLKAARGSELYQFPAELTQHTKDVYLTTQRNRADAYWAKVHNRSDLMTQASAQYQSVVIYNGASISRDVLSHEMGHNLAQARYGSMHPDDFGDFAKATRGEKPPSDYGATSRVEDFAESVRMYAVSPKLFKERNPRRHAVVDRMLKDPNYAG